MKRGLEGHREASDGACHDGSCMLRGLPPMATSVGPSLLLGELLYLVCSLSGILN